MSQPPTPCQAQNPAKCRYHGAERKVVRLTQLVLENPKGATPEELKPVLDELFNAQMELENLKRRGGESFLECNGKVNSLGKPPAHLVNLAAKIREPLMEGIQLHHLGGDYTAPIEAKKAERILHDALNKAGYVNTWDEGGHAPGADIHIPNFPAKGAEPYGISVKTGTTALTSKKNGARLALTLSGSRLTSHDTFEAKLAFLKASSPDAYFSLSRPKVMNAKRIGETGEVEYTAFLFAGSLLNFGEAKDWSAPTAARGRKWTNLTPQPPLMSATVVRSMSDQLWFSLDIASPNMNAVQIKIRARATGI